MAPSENQRAMFSEAEFDAPAVTVWNIAGQLLPRVREFARSDQLILVGHIVEVHARLETVVVEKIAELPVVQPLRGGILPFLVSVKLLRVGSFCATANDT